MIEKMKAVCVITQDNHKEELLTTLRDMGILHIAEKKSADAFLLERFSMISKLLLELKDYANGEEETKDLTDEQFEEMYASSIEALDKKAMLKSRMTELSLELDRLKPWGDFDSEEIRNLPKNIKLHFYKLDKKAYKELCKNDEINFVHLASVEKMETVAVLGNLSEEINALEFIVPERGPVQLRESIKLCEEELLKCDETLILASKHLKSYANQLQKTENDKEYSSVGKTLDEDGSLIWLSGYIPESEEEGFIKTAKAKNWAWIINDVKEDDTNVPTKVRYNKLTALMKPIFDILGVVPGYREYDISFWFLAFFTLFFAMIIGDAGYGALFLAGTIAFNIITKKLTNITLLLYILSGATVAWGSVTGTWFGLEGAMNIPLLKALVIPNLANYPQYFSMESSAVQNNVMKFCFSIGVIQLALACIMNIRRKLISKNLAWLSDVGWLLSISALYFLVLNLVIGESINILSAGTIIGIGFIMVVVFGGMEPGKSFAQGLKSGLGNAFTIFLDTISAFGNLMSYIRLFAVGMASLAIAQSFNDMALGFSGPLVIAGIVILIIGHLLNIIMGFLSVVVHGVRLNLLEFSGQLGMEWSGTSYSPFRKIKKQNKQ